MGSGVPPWVWIGAALVAVPVLLVIAAVGREALSARPLVDVRLGATRVELWHSRRLPKPTDLLLVPVGPDMKPTAGSALWARGVSAGALQRYLAGQAPRQPGDAVVGPGARYRIARVAAAIVMDGQKRFAAAWIKAAVQRAVAVAADRPVTSVTIPDWTPDLMRQPRRIDAVARRSSADVVAPMVVEAALALVGNVHVVRIWIRDNDSVPAYTHALSAAATSPQAVAA